MTPSAQSGEGDVRRRIGIIWSLRRGLLAVGLAAALMWGSAWGFAAWEQRPGGAYLNPDGPNVWTREKIDGMKDPLSPFLAAIVGSPQARSDRSKFGTSVVLWESGLVLPIETRL